jgi:hypothetical protein
MTTTVCRVTVAPPVVDGDPVTGQNQNAAPKVAREMVRLVLARPTEGNTR